MKAKIIFAWYDFWIGMFWDKKKRYLYIFPIPMLGVLLKFPERVLKPKKVCRDTQEGGNGDFCGWDGTICEYEDCKNYKGK